MGNLVFFSKTCSRDPIVWLVYFVRNRTKLNLVEINTWSVTEIEISACVLDARMTALGR